MKDCIFCQIYSNKREVFYEDSFFFSRFDYFPCAPGHVEIIPKRHVISLQNLTQEEWSQYHLAIKKTIKVINKTNLKEIYDKLVIKNFSQKSRQFCLEMLVHQGLNQKTKDYLIGWNEGIDAGRTINHLHLHIIPAYPGDVLPGGLRHAIKNKGNYQE